MPSPARRPGGGLPSQPPDRLQHGLQPRDPRDPGAGPVARASPARRSASGADPRVRRLVRDRPLSLARQLRLHGVRDARAARRMGRLGRARTARSGSARGRSSTGSARNRSAGSARRTEPGKTSTGMERHGRADDRDGRRRVHRQPPGRAAGDARAIGSAWSSGRGRRRRTCRRASRSSEPTSATADAVREAVRGGRWVYHLAANPNLWVRDRAEFDAVNHRGTVHVLDAALEAGAERILHTSTESILTRARHTGPIAEDVEIALVRRRRAVLPVEAPGRERGAGPCPGRGSRSSIANPTMPVGPGDRGPSPPTRLIRDFCRGRLPARMDCTLNLIDVRDVAEGLIRTMERGEPGRRYLLGGENLTLARTARHPLRADGCPRPSLARPLRAGAGRRVRQRVLGRPRDRPDPQGDRHGRPTDPEDHALRPDTQPRRARPAAPTRPPVPGRRRRLAPPGRAVRGPTVRKGPRGRASSWRVATRRMKRRILSGPHAVPEISS